MLKKLLLSLLVAACATAAGAQTVVWSEDFETGTGTTLPTGWTQTTLATDGGWQVDAGANLSSQSYSVPDNGTQVIATNDDKCNCDKSADLLITPAINLSAYTSLYLLFDVVYYHGAYQGIQEAFDLLASTDNGATWTTISAMPVSGQWKTAGFDISAYAGKPSVKFGFRYNDNAGWLFGAALDNVKVVVPDAVVRASLTNTSVGRIVDGIPTYVSGYTKYWTGSQMLVEGVVNNTGFVPITTFDAKWTRDGSSYSQTFTGLNIGFGASYTFTLDFTATSGAQTGTFSMELGNVNGAPDSDPTDNVQDLGTFEGVDQPVPNRKVVIEEATGTWCQWCPRGAVMMKYMKDNYPDLVAPVAVHNSQSGAPDPMQLAAYNTGLTTLPGFSGFPSGVVDRSDIVDPTQFEQVFVDEMTKPAQVIVSHDVAVNTTTRKATIVSHVHFIDGFTDDVRVAVVFTEDTVTGTASGYAQHNAYAGGGAGPMGGFEGLASLVPAASMVYDHVNRALIGGFTGAAGSIPAPITPGLDVDYTSTYTIPAAYKINHLNCITMLIDNTTGKVLNAEHTPVPFGTVAAHEPAAIAIDMSVFPNPVTDVVNVKFNLKDASDVRVGIYDINGRLEMENSYSNLSGEQQMPFQVGKLPVGTYLLTVSTKGQSATQEFVIVR